MLLKPYILILLLKMTAYNTDQYKLCKFKIWGGKVMSNIDNKQAMPKATEGSEQ